MSLAERYPVGGLLISHFVDGDLRFFRIIGNTSQKVRINQIVPFHKVLQPGQSLRVPGNDSYRKFTTGYRRGQSRSLHGSCKSV